MFESIILGLLQGLAEFLPISSSGHLVLGHELLGMNEAGMFFDIMLHAGTLLSIFVVFHKKITDIIVGCLRRDKDQLREAGFIILASIPTAMIGLGFKGRTRKLVRKPARRLRRRTFHRIAPIHIAVGPDRRQTPR